MMGFRGVDNGEFFMIKWLVIIFFLCEYIILIQL